MYIKPILTIALLALAAPAPAQVMFGDAPGDWSGTYVGGTIGYGDLGYSTDDGASEQTLSDNDASYSAVLGRQVQTGRVVLGGELALLGLGGQLTNAGPPDGGNLELESAIRLSGKLGYDLGSALIYGTAGLARASFSGEGNIDGIVDEDSSGYAIGLGMDFKASPRMTIGAEYVRYRFNDLLDDPVSGELEGTINTVGLKVTYGF